jgi:hypothetical protein
LPQTPDFLVYESRSVCTPRHSPYKMRQSCDCHDCHTVTIVGDTCGTSTDYIGELNTTWIIVTDCQFVISPVGSSVTIGYYPSHDASSGDRQRTDRGFTACGMAPIDSGTGNWLCYRRWPVCRILKYPPIQST